MANTKISALTAATTPLAGTEVLPVVQSSTTKQVSVANLTAGRAVSASSLTLTGSPLATTSGGTGLTSFTSNGVVYASSSSALATNSLFNYNGSTSLTLDNTSNVTFSIRAYDTGNDRNAGLQLLSSGNGGSVATITYGDTDTTPGTPSPLEFYGYHSGVTTKRFIMGTGGDFTLSTGNVVIGTSGKGIDFSATAGTGTSELLADYEEGTWTPTATGGLTVNSATYTKVGRQVTLMADVTAVALTSGDITGLPFTNGATNASGVVAYQTNTALVTWGVIIDASSTNMSFRLGSTQQQLAATRRAYFSVVYFV